MKEPFGYQKRKGHLKLNWQLFCVILDGFVCLNIFIGNIYELVNLIFSLYTLDMIFT